MGPSCFFSIRMSGAFQPGTGGGGEHMITPPIYLVWRADTLLTISSREMASPLPPNPTGRVVDHEASLLHGRDGIPEL